MMNDTQTRDSAESRASGLGLSVAAEARRLQEGYQRDTAASVAALARLRNALGRSPADTPEVWSILLPVIGDDLGSGDEPSPREWAAHTALTLFALHQQSVHDQGMHQSGVSFGRAVGLLIRRNGGFDEQEASPLLRRFQALVTASSFREASNHARGFVTLFRRSDSQGRRISLDYGRLTDDLVALQDRRASSVRLQWGRDLHGRAAHDSADSDKPTSKASEGEDQ